MLPIESHDEFLELCALSASGSLTEEERRRLETHLAVCLSCREAKRQFETVVDRAIPALAASGDEEPAPADPAWSVKTAEAEFFRRLEAEEGKCDKQSAAPDEEPDAPVSLAALDTTWRHVWSLYAAGILLFISLGFSAYQFGTHRNRPIAASPAVPQPDTRIQNSLEQQLSDVSHEREIVRSQVAQKDKIIAGLRRELEQRSTELAQMEAAQEERKAEAAVSKSGQQEQAQLTERLQSAQSQLKLLQSRLDGLQQQSSQDADRAAAMQAKVTDLTRELEKREGEVNQQQELLAHDRDIRELMGARDLYITEVYDVARSGETQKAYGRVFYTKDKSLIFYAYDLDRQAGIKDASTFQAWGRRGPDRQQALNLGVFFEDNVAKKRWVLKFDDPKTLARIDAVFVTVEPNGGSRRPSGKPLLFAYLKVDPNHP